MSVAFEGPHCHQSLCCLHKFVSGMYELREKQMKPVDFADLPLIHSKIITLIALPMGSNAAGAIFLLKNMGYTDRQDVRPDPVEIVIKGIDPRF